jgi:hypothetical protein
MDAVKQKVLTLTKIYLFDNEQYEKHTNELISLLKELKTKINSNDLYTLLSLCDDLRSKCTILHFIAPYCDKLSPFEFWDIIDTIIIDKKVYSTEDLKSIEKDYHCFLEYAITKIFPLLGEDIALSNILIKFPIEKRIEMINSLCTTLLEHVHLIKDFKTLEHVLSLLTKDPTKYKSIVKSCFSLFISIEITEQMKQVYEACQNPNINKAISALF